MYALVFVRGCLRVSGVSFGYVNSKFGVIFMMFYEFGVDVFRSYNFFSFISTVRLIFFLFERVCFGLW